MVNVCMWYMIILGLADSVCDGSAIMKASTGINSKETMEVKSKG